MSESSRNAADHLIVALDVSRPEDADHFCDLLAGAVRWVKVGLELFVARGPSAVVRLKERGFEVFLDLKLHDIPNTVERAVGAAVRSGASMLNVHAGGGEVMMEAAARGASQAARESGRPGPAVLAVTMLTSLTGQELPGYYADRPVIDRVVTLARAAKAAGLQGVVASARELGPLRAVFPAEFILLTPGIRFEEGGTDDQKRVVTPRRAIADGADYLVMGRPITADPDPRGAARRALEEMARGFADRTAP